MKNIKERYGEWALITGASDGIGESFAIELARHGISSVLVARRTERWKWRMRKQQKLIAIHESTAWSP